MLDPAKLTFLATNYDPTPILEAINQSGGMGTEFSTMATPPGAAPQQPFTQMLQPSGGPNGGPPPPTPGAMNPALMMQMMQMGQQKPQQQMPMAPAAAPRATPPVQVQPIAPMPQAGAMTRILGR